MLMRLQKYSLEVKYKPGKELHVADALSRACLNEHKEILIDEEMEVNCISHQLPVSEEKLRDFRNATAEDPELRLVAKAIQSGWPEKQRQLPDNIKQYWTFREELSYEDGLIFKNSRLVVPHTMRSEMLRKVHESHLGIVKCKERARDVLFWPGMAKQIEEVVAHCAVCNTHRHNNPKEPLMPHPVPERAWEKVGVDLFHFNDSEFLLCVDYFSKFPEIVKLRGTTSKHIIIALKSIFARLGVPDELFSDNGRQLVSQEMEDFSTAWDFKHTTSSPTFPQSNGQAERAVQTVKNLLKKAQDSGGDPYLALLEYRNTPLDGVGLSPAQLLLGRRLKSKLPVSKALLQPALHENARSDLVRRQDRQKQSFDQRTRTLSELQDGENVRIRQGSKWEPDTVINKHNLPRSYIVKTPSGQVYRRNRRHLLQTKET
uniref:Gypsy retrotransposon integrase-like protein 1 n=1 Tax=Oryzias latipes TaxID=8090 RepID=A0A3P9IGQ4_ORYLA